MQKLPPVNIRNNKQQQQLANDQNIIRGPSISPASPSIHHIYEKAKVSQKSLTPNMIAYGANTHNGIFRNYNEDRISIVLDLKKPGLRLDSKK